MPLLTDPLFAWNIISDAPDLMVLAVLALVVAGSFHKTPLEPPFGQSLGRFRDAQDDTAAARDPHSLTNRWLATTLVIALFFLGLCLALRIVGKY